MEGLRIGDETDESIQIVFHVAIGREHAFGFSDLHDAVYLIQLVLAYDILDGKGCLENGQKGNAYSGSLYPDQLLNDDPVQGFCKLKADLGLGLQRGGGAEAVYGLFRVGRMHRRY